MAVSPPQVIKLYRSLLFEASKFPLYNFRMYALRRIRDEFRLNKLEKNPVAIGELYKEGVNALELIKRQVIVSQLYRPEKLVIEKVKERNR